MVENIPLDNKTPHNVRLSALEIAQHLNSAEQPPRADDREDLAKNK